MSTLQRLCLGQATSTWYSLFGKIFNAYRPELHYMRGPGPKWRAKHEQP